jgi:hypothetical protein
MNKEYIKSIDNEETLLQKLRDISRTLGDGVQLKKIAFSYNLKL